MSIDAVKTSVCKEWGYMELKQVARKSLSDTTREYLLEYIKQANLDHQQKLPPERQIAEQLSVSRVTVRKALDDLESIGVLLRIHGKGTFINPNMTSIDLNLTPGRDFFQIITAAGYTASSRLIRFRIEEADAHLTEQLRLAPGSRLLLIHKLFLANSRPVIFAADYVPLPLAGPDLESGTLSQSTFQLILDGSGVQCVQDTVAVSACGRTEIEHITESQGMLDCESALMLESVNYDIDNQPVFFCRVLYDTSVIHFRMFRTLDVNPYPTDETVPASAALSSDSRSAEE